MSIIVCGNRVILRDRLPSDVDTYVRWWSKGEWLKYDAPWEIAEILTTTTKEEIRRRFLDGCAQRLPLPRDYAIIAMFEESCGKENKPLGWVNRYVDKRFPSAWLIGINICEDDYLNKGLGTEAFGLWVDYLFLNSDIHRIGFDTYSFNKRMIRVGEKLGFTHEGTDREIIYWQNEWIDRLHFGMLRSEWEARRKKSKTGLLHTTK